MTAVSEDATADLNRRIAELERRLETALIERDTAIERQTASALVNFRLQNELRAAVDRQHASADILRAISRTPGDAGRSLQQIAETSARLFGAPSVSIQLVRDGAWAEAYRFGDSATRVRAAVPLDTIRIGGPNLPGTVVAENRQIHLPDLDHLDPAFAHWPGPPHARAAGTRTMCGTPLRLADEAIGVLIVYRDRLAPFTAEELALQQSFADQAVIAIENARLFNETREALERQTATADILKVISQSPTDVQPVFDAIVQTAVRLFGCETAFIQRCDGSHFWGVARCGRDGLLPIANPQHTVVDPNANFPSRAIVEQQTLYLPDWSEIELPEYEQGIQSRLGYQSALYLPLVREAECIGLLGMGASRPRMFGETEIALAESFRDQALIAIENTRLFNETEQALERQTATADILKVIASSPSDTQPVFDAIAASANRLLGGYSTAVFRLSDGIVYLAAFTPTNPAADEALKADFPRPVDTFEPIQLTRPGEPFPIPDTEEVPHPRIRDIARLHGFRSMLFVPLMNAGSPIGVIAVTRADPGGFAPHHVQLLRTFADQAVIAIENARLFNETEEALERQTATADILRVISQSPTDVQPVFDAVVLTARRLLRREMAFILHCDETTFRNAATAGPEGLLPIRNPIPMPIDPEANFPSRAIVAKTNQQVPDWSAIDLPEQERHVREVYGLNSALYLPMSRGDQCIGVLGIGGQQAGHFSASDIALAESFRDQAVIAIENTRLFNETQEALAHQVAMSEVLQVIGKSMADARPVFERIVESLQRLFDHRQIALFLTPGDGLLHWVAGRGANERQVQAVYPLPVEQTAAAAVIEARQQVYYPDILHAEDVPESLRRVAEASGNFSDVLTPMLWEGRGVGMIAVTREPNVPFSERELSLLQTFADQAVIAIENARLFNEVQARTLELTESLEQQTATAEVLSVISSSGGDLAPVFDAMLAKAMQLCSANFGVLNTYDGRQFHTAATFGLPPAYDEHRRSQPLDYGPGTAPARLLAGEAVVEIDDLLDSESYRSGDANRRALVDLGGARCLLAVPLLKDERVVGNVMIFRQDKRPFSAKQITLLQQFAAQAVIAIENTRLLRELRQRTDDLQESLQQQTATADVLKVISRSTFDLQTVLETLIKSAVALSDANRGSIFLREGDVFPLKAASSATPDFLEYWAANPPRSGRGSATARVIESGKVEIIPDVLEDPEMQMPAGTLVRIRATLGVPMLRDNKVEGVLVLTRPEPGPFSKSQIDLVQTFADQAVIAVENVRLFDEAQARTRELAKSLDDLRTAQDRLVQTEKLASLGQLTAGIAHEIKNPLNFVNNFAALSAELTDELKESLKPAVLDEAIRAEVEELTGLLKDNLGKVVQHGKRADSIVKNMLLHSREGSGEHRPADVNALVDESLNLAYHGARAEKPQFNVTLQRDFDAEAGQVEVFPQEITRVLLNLISNGFYAVTKRKAENGGTDFEPIVSATTKGRTDNVEICIRDNGTGIPPDVKEKMFNPFFTTKPAGEGTGLGLSMSHDIIVNQHGGTIDVDTREGQFTAFTIVLPRKSNLSDKSRGQT